METNLNQRNDLPIPEDLTYSCKSITEQRNYRRLQTAKQKCLNEAQLQNRDQCYAGRNFSQAKLKIKEKTRPS